jgi:hypothetical protein
MRDYRFRESSVGIATGYGLDDRMTGVRCSARDGNFSLGQLVQTGSGVHPASFPPDQSHPSSAEVKENVELYLISSSTSSWHGA